MKKVGIDPWPVHFFAFFLAVRWAVAHNRGAVSVTRLRRIPVRGESIVETDYRFTVEQASDRTVMKLRVAPADAATPSSLGDERRGR